MREKRQNPNVLYPGDQVYIPDRALKKEACETSRRSRFVAPAQTVTLRIVLRGFNERPIANMPFVLKVEDKVYSLTSGSDGLIEQKIPKTAESGTLIFRNMEVPLRIGHLDPVDTVTGYEARLNNLGYNAGTSGDPENPQLQSAIQEFQCDQGLNVDGILGPATQAKLKEVHGS